LWLVALLLPAGIGAAGLRHVILLLPLLLSFCSSGATHEG